MSNLDVTVRLRAELGDFATSMEQAAKSLEKVGKAADQVQSTGKPTAASADEIKRAIDGVGDAAGKSTSDVDKAATAQQNLGNASKKAASDIEGAGKKADGTAKATGRIGEEAASAASKTQSAAQKFDQSFIKSKTHAEDLGKSIKKLDWSGGGTKGAAGMLDALGGAQQRANEMLSKGAAHARKYSAEWTKIGAGLSVAGGAVLATGAAALTAGINYNTLQQKSHSALKVLTGGAKEANAQMAKMDAFAKTSPFSKATFLQAQQQMLGFGIEAKKVVPYLEAIQDSVAATGGNNQQIAELSLIFSQIQSAQKITAQDMMQFGQRGIDAATLIGTQMGKTGQQIREGITAGTLDAEAALDALAAGMTERFGGAAAGMKDTFEGATDRLKAAWRDFGAELAKPLVSPDGGGFLVDLTNGAADALRNFEKLPPGIKSVTTGVAGLGAAAAVGVGGFMMLAPRVLESWEALKKFGVTADKAKGWAGKIGTVGAAAAGVTMLATALGRLASDANQAQIDKSMGRVSTAIADMVTDTGKGTEALDVLFQKRDGSALIGEVGSLESAFQWMAKDDWQNRFDRWGQGLVNAFNPDIKGSVATMTDAFERLDQGLADLVTSGKTEEAAAAFDQIKAAAERQGVGLEEVEGSFKNYLDAVAQLEAEGKYDATPTIKTLSELQDQAAETASEVAKLGQELDALGNINRSADKAISDYYASLNKASEAAKNSNDGISQLTAAGQANREILRDLAGNAMAAATGMATLGESEATVRKHLSSSYDQFVNLATGMGASKTEAEDLARTLLGIPEGVEVKTWMDNTAQELAEATKASVDDIPDIKNVDVIVTEDGGIEVTKTQLESIEDRTVGIGVTDNGTIMEVQGGINNVEGKTEYLLVDDNGTVQTVQKKIINVKGKKETVFVTDDGTVVKVQGQINGIKGKNVVATATAATGAAEAALNYLTRTRSAVIQATIKNMGQAAVATGGRAPLAKPGAAGAFPVKQRYGTGGVASLPGYSMGGQLPYTGLGIDQMLAINHQGIPIAWVDDGEWIIRQRMAEKYNRLLSMVNMDHPSVRHLAGYASGGKLTARQTSTHYTGAPAATTAGTVNQTNITLSPTINNPVGEPTARAIERDLALLANPQLGGVKIG